MLIMLLLLLLLLIAGCVVADFVIAAPSAGAVCVGVGRLTATLFSLYISDVPFFLALTLVDLYDYFAVFLLWPVVVTTSPRTGCHNRESPTTRHHSIDSLLLLLPTRFYFFPTTA